MKSATEKMNTRVQALRAFYDKEKRLPSYREMLSIFQVQSKQSVARIVEKLVTADIVQKDTSGKLIPGTQLHGIRLLGAVQAGFPSPAEEELADMITLDDYLIENKQATFMLRVAGESMIDAGIHPGDYVLVERGRSPKQNDIVIAFVDDEYTMKHYQKDEHGQVVLMPANSAFPPIIANTSLSIEGVVTSVIRKY